MSEALKRALTGRPLCAKRRHMECLPHCEYGIAGSCVRELLPYVCKQCGRGSYHPADAVNRYCVTCHRYEDDQRP